MDILTEVILVITISLIVILMVMRGCIAYRANHTNEEKWDKRLTFMLAAITCAGAIFEIYHGFQNVRENTEHSRTEAAFQMIHELDEGDLLTQFNQIRLDASNSTNVVSKERIRNDIEAKDHTNLQHCVITTLGKFNDIAMAIRSGRANEDILYYALNGLMDWSATNLDLFIEDVAKKRIPDHPNKRQYLTEFWELTDAWRDKRSLLTKRPYFGYSYIQWMDTNHIDPQ